MAGKGGITSFRSEILNKGGVQVASHFEFHMVFPRRQPPRLPPAPNESTQSDELRLNRVVVTSSPLSILRCESVSLPDLSVNTMETHRFGFGTQDIVPYALSYFETVATFIGDQQGTVYKLFYDWFNIIMKMPDNATTKTGTLSNDDYEVGFKSDIVVEEAKIIAYDHTHTPIYTVTLFDVFPRSITTTTLNWAAGDELVRYTTFLSFKDFKVDFHKLDRPPTDYRIGTIL